MHPRYSPVDWCSLIDKKILLSPQVRMAMDLGVSRTQAALLPGYMALAQSAGKVILGKIATFPRTDKIMMYQVALLANCLATTTCPTITSYSGLVAYAVVFGLQDGCTSANNMLVVGDLVSKKQLSTGYSIFLVTSAASFLLGPPVAGTCHTTRLFQGDKCISRLINKQLSRSCTQTFVRDMPTTAGG